MGTKQRFAVQSLLTTVILNAILLAAIYILVGNAVQAGNRTFLFFVIGALITLLLWLAIFFVGSSFIGREAPAQVPPAVAEAAPPPAQRAKPVEPARSAEAGAAQMLAILQRQGRLIDFLQEDMSMYDDAQIGAAVRAIHDGCRQALSEHVRLEPIFREAEGSPVTVPVGFDTHAVRLTGNVLGAPPFSGALRHRGWRVASLELPRQVEGQEKEMIVAAAEVEVNA